MIKFNLYNVTDTVTKEKNKVRYSINNRWDGRNCVTIYADGYGSTLMDLFPNDCKNDSDSMTDYFETDKVRLFEEHPLYQAALIAAKERELRREERYKKRKGECA